MLPKHPRAHESPKFPQDTDAAAPGPRGAAERWASASSARSRLQLNPEDMTRCGGKERDLRRTETVTAEGVWSACLRRRGLNEA